MVRIKKVILILSTLVFLFLTSLAVNQIFQSDDAFAAATCYECKLADNDCWECKTGFTSGGTSCTASCSGCSVSGSCHSQAT